MQVFFNSVFLLKETKKFSLFKRIFKKIQVCDVCGSNDKTFDVMIILNCKFEKMRIKKKIKIAKKLKSIVGENSKIILSEKLKQDDDFTDLLYSNDFNIINGKKLFKTIIVQFIEFVCKDNKIKCEESQIAITINDANSLDLKYIEELAKRFKTLNIVTNNIKYFKSLEEKLWINNGIIITATNNKKKALVKSNIILNVDFPEEILNKYSICDNGILINLEENVKIKKKRFNGKILNNYKIKLRKNSNIQKELEKIEYQDFNLNDLAEIYVANNPNAINDIIVCK